MMDIDIATRSSMRVNACLARWPSLRNDMRTSFRYGIHGRPGNTPGPRPETRQGGPGLSSLECQRAGRRCYRRPRGPARVFAWPKGRGSRVDPFLALDARLSTLDFSTFDPGPTGRLR